MCFSLVLANPVSCLDNWEWDTLVGLIFYSLSFVSFLWYSLKAFWVAVFNSRTLCSWALKYICIFFTSPFN